MPWLHHVVVMFVMLLVNFESLLLSAAFSCHFSPFTSIILSSSKVFITSRSSAFYSSLYHDKWLDDIWGIRSTNHGLTNPSKYEDVTMGSNRQRLYTFLIFVVQSVNMFVQNESSPDWNALWLFWLFLTFGVINK